MDALPNGLLDGIGVVGIVALVGWLIFTGRLVPRRTYDDMVHDRDEWRTAHRISETARQEERDHNQALQHEFGSTLTAFLRGLRSQTGGDEQ